MTESEKAVTTGVQKAREKFRTIIEAAQLRGQRTIIERYDSPIAVVVSVGDYRLLAALDGRPELLDIVRRAAAEDGE